MAGRRLAKAFRPARMASRPRSGRCAEGRVSHLYLQHAGPCRERAALPTAKQRHACAVLIELPYPPMAASSTASEALAVARVWSGRGTPVASIAAPPISSGVY